jgi:hypothetical protein
METLATLRGSENCSEPRERGFELCGWVGLGPTNADRRGGREEVEGELLEAKGGGRDKLGLREDRCIYAIDVKRRTRKSEISERHDKGNGSIPLPLTT